MWNNVFASKNISAFGVNCCQFEVVDNALQEFKKFSIPFGVLPNGFKTIKPMILGNSADSLKKRIDVDPPIFVEYSMRWINFGCKFVGGCCEIGPKFIKLLYHGLLKSKIEITNVLWFKGNLLWNLMEQKIIFQPKIYLLR